MKIALDWIGEYLSPVPAAAVVAEALMNGGLPVESTEEAMGVKGSTQVLDVEVTSNRTDCFCHVGLAREISALCGGTFRMPGVVVQEAGAAAGSLTAVEIKDLAGCPYYSARVIRNVKVGPSPEWLRRRLESIGLRPVNNVVDVTNFVLMELGQPLHAFDYDKLAEKRIVVRRAAKGEKMVAIDGREYALDESMLVIADAVKPVAIAGVMGGKETEVTGGAGGTTTVLLESARFEALTTRTTSRALGLKSDSSFRFERGIDPAMAELASRRAAQLIVEVGGGEVAAGVVSAGEAKAKLPQVRMRMKRFKAVVGISVAPERAEAILSALGFSPSVEENKEGDADDVLCVRVPSWRLDVEREIDLIEEVARVHGYQHVPTLDHVTHPVKPEPVREKAARVIRTALVEAGFSEAVTLTFIAEAEAVPFVAADATLIHPQHAAWKSDVLRPSLLPSLLAVRRTNQYAGIADAWVFETAEVFEQRGDPAQRMPDEIQVLAAVAGEISALTGLLTLLAARLNPAMRMWVEPAEFRFFVPGASGKVMLQVGQGKPELVGHVGLFTEELRKRYDLRQAAAGLELDREPLISAYEPTRRALPVPRFPGVNRDLSMVMEEKVRWAEIKEAVVGAKLAFLEQVEFVTTFRNAAVGAGKKSLTLTLDFRDPARTLKSEEVDTQVAMAVEVLGKRFGAVLRA